MPFTGAFKPFSLLLTGAPGWLCDAVLSQLGGALPALTRVRCLVRRGTAEDQVAEWRLKHPSVTEIATGDLLDAASLRAVCEQMRGGVVLHAAAVFHPAKLRDYTSVNRDATLALAAIAREAGVRRFVFVSSTAAQGASKSLTQPLTEDMPCRPYSAYGKSKFEAEQYVLKLAVPGTFDVVIVRPGPFYGTPVPPHHVELFKRLKSGRVRLVGGGKYARSWSAVRDVAAGTIRCLHHPNAAGEIFNLCDAQICTQREIYEAAAEALHVRPRFRRMPAFTATFAQLSGKLAATFGRYSAARQLLADQNRHSGASIQKAKTLLAFEPRMNVREGLRQAVAWCRDQGIID